MVNIQKILDKTGKSVAELAEYLEVAESTVYRWIAGDTTPRLDLYFKLKELIDEDIQEDS
jgi:predicted transcriptional regulator